MHWDDVARFDSGTACRDSISAAAVVVIRAHDRVKSGLDLGALVARGINMKHAPTRVRLRLGPRPHRLGLSHGLTVLPQKTIRIRHDKSSLIRRIGFQIENAARKHVWRHHVKHALVLVSSLALQTQYRQAL